MTGARFVIPFPVQDVSKNQVEERNLDHYSSLENDRLKFTVPIPTVLTKPFKMETGTATSAAGNAEDIKALFPNMFGQPSVQIVANESAETRVMHVPKRIGCVLSGGQAAGGHNCIVGLFDYVEKHAPGSKIYGFIGGPKGVMDGRFRILDAEFVDKYRNTGGFDMLTAGRDKIESPEQFAAARNTMVSHELDGLVVIGGDDSNTNAALLAENFASNGLKTRVIGLPKTIDGDLKNEYVETSFGFDTAAKVYAECVGNIQTDCASTQKYYHFIRLMGREASHLTLEVALQARPNMTFIGEEVRAKQYSLSAITNIVADMVDARAKAGKNYGVVMIPEGLIDFVPEVSELIANINEVLATECAASEVAAKLSDNNRAVFEYLPSAIQEQLLLDRDPHGNVQVAKIESERLLALLVEKEIEKRKASGTSTAMFSVQCHYFGYEGRCAPPTDFDCNYCYALGLTAGALLGHNYTGMMASVRNLCRPVSEWTVYGMPLTHMMNVERRKGKNKPVIRKALVELEGAPYKAFCSFRDSWMLEDAYRNPGPIQFALGTDKATFTLRCEQQGVSTTEAAIAAAGCVKSNRATYEPQLPGVFTTAGQSLSLVDGRVLPTDVIIKQGMPQTSGKPMVELRAAGRSSEERRDIKLGVVFSGRQTPGGHTALAGMKHYLDKFAGTNSELIGFVGGTKGLFAGNSKVITNEWLAEHGNTGGFEMLGRTADVIRGNEHYEAVAKVCNDLKLDGLAIIGGTHSMCDAGVLAEELMSRDVKTEVIGVPGTIDGDLKSEHIEATFGYDTACRCYSSLIGNLQTDAASARKYYYFIRLMGRAPSQIVLECGLQTQPNMVIIGEELEHNKKTLNDVVREIADMVEARQSNGKNFGVILIPEGLVEYIPELRTLLREVSDLFAEGLAIEEVKQKLSPWAKAMLASLPEVFQEGILREQENSTGSAQLNQIETERLFAELVSAEMTRRKTDPSSKYNGSFSPVSFYLGYQARSSFPSNFDCNLAYTLGCTSAALVASKPNMTGYVATANGLTGAPRTWRCGAVPISTLLTTGRRGGKNVAILPPSTVSLTSNAFLTYMQRREQWMYNDCYSNPGPLQFKGATADTVGRALEADHAGMESKRRRVEEQLDSIRNIALGSSVMPNMLDATIHSLDSLKEILEIVHRAEGVARNAEIKCKSLN